MTLFARRERYDFRRAFASHVPHDERVQAASARIPVRERSSNFPAFDTDWDVPAFQRKGH